MNKHLSNDQSQEKPPITQNKPSRSAHNQPSDQQNP